MPRKGSSNARIPKHFHRILEWLRVPPERVRLLAGKHLVRELRVAGQAEQLGILGPPEVYLDYLDECMAHHDILQGGGGIVYVTRAELPTWKGRHAGEAYVTQKLHEAGVHVVVPEKLDVFRQLEIYAAADILIFAEGSAIHGRQLLGRLAQDIVVMARRNHERRHVEKLRQRCDKVTYWGVNDGMFSFPDPNTGVPAHWSAMMTYDLEALFYCFRHIGVELAQDWNMAEFEAARDADLLEWLSMHTLHTKKFFASAEEQDHAYRQLEQLGLGHLAEPARRIFDQIV